MGKGGYLGGSTVIRSYPAASRKRRTRGLLALEAEFKKTGKVRPETLLPEAVRKSATGKRTKPKVSQTGSSTKVADARPPVASTLSAASANGRYSAEEIRKFVVHHHPRCQGAALKRVIKLGEQGRWTGMQVREVVASCMEQHLLYEVFSIPRLVSCGLTQERALRMVAPLVREVLAEWCAEPVWLR